MSRFADGQVQVRKTVARLLRLLDQRGTVSVTDAMIAVWGQPVALPALVRLVKDSRNTLTRNGSDWSVHVDGDHIVSRRVDG